MCPYVYHTGFQNVFETFTYAEVRGRCGSVQVGIVADRVEQGQDFLRVIRFSPAYKIPPWLSILIYHLGDEQ
jgi:hypothetical protein